MSTAQVFPQIDKVTSVLVWIILGIAGALLLGFGLILGCIFAAILLPLVAFASIAIVVVLVGMSLLKVGIAAIESYLRVRAAKLAYATVQRRA